MGRGKQPRTRGASVHATSPRGGATGNMTTTTTLLAGKDNRDTMAFLFRGFSSAARDSTPPKWKATVSLLCENTVDVPPSPLPRSRSSAPPLSLSTGKKKGARTSPSTVEDVLDASAAEASSSASSSSETTVSARILAAAERQKNTQLVTLTDYRLRPTAEDTVSLGFLESSVARRHEEEDGIFVMDTEGFHPASEKEPYRVLNVSVLYRGVTVVSCSFEDPRFTGEDAPELTSLPEDSYEETAEDGCVYHLRTVHVPDPEARVCVVQDGRGGPLVGLRFDANRSELRAICAQFDAILDTAAPEP